jgi:hypothetical protein
MEQPLVDKLKVALREIGYTDDEFALESTPTGRVGGRIVSEAFLGESQINRQSKLWAELEKRLSGDELAQIIALLTVTPLEIGNDDDDLVHASR